MSNCFRAVVEIPCSESQQYGFALKLEILDYVFYVFLHAISKKRKKSRFLDFKKRKITYSRTMEGACTAHNFVAGTGTVCCLSSIFIKAHAVILRKKIH